jgi:glycosyltransferase involved in cell wall biosynthesis
MRLINRLIIISSLKGLCKKLKIKNPILWFVVPHLADVLGNLDEQLVVYYCIDDYASLPGVNREMIQKMDETLTKKSDIVFVSAQPLLESKHSQNPNVILSRHGVDYEHFNKACSADVEMAEEIKGLAKPVVGFFGLIETWVDLELVKFIAQARPQWNILMIGRVAVTQNPCEGLSNVHFIGSKKYEVLPQYAKIFDVAIIPCKINDLIINFNPLKLREYLAMGKPVVTIRVPEVEAFSDVVEIADSYQEFLEKIDLVLSNDNPFKLQKRQEKVKDSSWEHRVEVVTQEVDEVLIAKNAKRFSR